MPQMKKKSHASTPGPPDGSMPAVNSNRDEITRRLTKCGKKSNEPDVLIVLGDFNVKIGN